MTETSFRPSQPGSWAKTPEVRRGRMVVYPVSSHPILVGVDEKSHFLWNIKVNFSVWYLVLRVLCIYSNVQVYRLAMALPKLFQVLKWPIDSTIAKEFLLKHLELFLAAYPPKGRSIRKMNWNMLCIAMPAVCQSPK